MGFTKAHWDGFRNLIAADVVLQRMQQDSGLEIIPFIKKNKKLLKRIAALGQSEISATESDYLDAIRRYEEKAAGLDEEHKVLKYLYKNERGESKYLSCMFLMLLEAAKLRKGAEAYQNAMRVFHKAGPALEI